MRIKESIKEIGYTRIILSILAISGLITIAVFAPNALQVFKMFQKKKKVYPSYVTDKIKLLQRKNYVVLVKRQGVIYIQITDKGKQWLRSDDLKNKLEQTRKKKWDGKWRVVMFDIKEYRRKTRGKLRCQLNNFGFTKLQNSVWVSPYPCEEIIDLLKADLRIGKDLIYMTITKFEGEEKLKEYFHIK
jgi:CRISPR-associated endonuclease Cas2